MRSVKCKVWSVKCRVWSLKCKLWSVECKVWCVECEASPINTATPQENQRLETKHVGAEKRAFRARLPPILTFSTRYQTGWNVTKCHACHATTCLETFEKDKFASFPHRHGDATGKPETRDETRGCRKTSISCETSLPSGRYQTGWNVTKVSRLPRKTA